jgi:hypothetical protein
MSVTVLPYSPNFRALLKDYCEQISSRANRVHHDTIRHLFLNFLRETFGIDPIEVELEHKIKVQEVRGRISIVPKMQTPVATARADARHIVHGKLNKLDELVRKLLGNPNPKTIYPQHKSEPMKLMDLFS